MTYRHRKTGKIVTNVIFKMDELTPVTGKPMHEVYFTTDKNTVRVMPMGSFQNQYEKI